MTEIDIAALGPLLPELIRATRRKRNAVVGSNPALAGRLQLLLETLEKIDIDRLEAELQAIDASLQRRLSDMQRVNAALEEGKRKLDRIVDRMGDVATAAAVADEVLSKLLPLLL